MVMEMMVIAGEVFATLGAKASLPLPYRSQEVPVLPADDDLAHIPPGICRDYHLRRYMLKSTTRSDAPLPHHALGIPAYTQATSPIRRYIDMLAHWQMKALIRGDTTIPFDTTPLQSTIHELEASNRRLVTAERAIEHTWLCTYVASKPHGYVWSDAILLHWINQERGLGIVYIPELARETVAQVNHPVPLGGTVPLTSYADPVSSTLSFVSKIQSHASFLT